MQGTQNTGGPSAPLSVKLAVEFEEEGEKKEASLYEFLEGAFVAKLMRERQTFWFSG